MLWSKLKSKQLLDYKFRRQVSIGKYIVDFYCPELKLVIEIDGDLHYLSKETIKYDKIRQCSIELLGINFLRFTNIEVHRNLDGVLRTIESRLVNQPLRPSHDGRGTSPQLRGGK